MAGYLFRVYSAEPYFFRFSSIIFSSKMEDSSDDSISDEGTEGTGEYRLIRHDYDWQTVVNINRTKMSNPWVWSIQAKCLLWRPYSPRFCSPRLEYSPSFLDKKDRERVMILGIDFIWINGFQKHNVDKWFGCYTFQTAHPSTLKRTSNYRSQWMDRILR